MIGTSVVVSVAARWRPAVPALRIARVRAAVRIDAGNR